MTRCPSHCPKLSPICPAFRDNVGLRQALPNTAKSPRHNGRRPQEPTPITSSAAFEPPRLLLSCPPISAATTSAAIQRESTLIHQRLCASSFVHLKYVARPRNRYKISGPSRPLDIPTDVQEAPLAALCPAPASR
jgi:hypothetical protein